MASGEAPSAPRNEELEAVIIANPDDSAGYQVYGDWLQAQGDVLGELVSIQTKLATDPDNAGLRAAEKALFEEHTSTFLGPEVEAEQTQELGYEKIEDYSWPEGWAEKAWHYGFATVEWRNGFMHSVLYDSGYYDEEDERGSDVAAEPLAALLALPAARFVQRVAFADLWANYDEGEGPEMEEGLKVVVNAPCTATLRELHFTGGDHDTSGVSLDDEGIAEACPNLESLVLYAGMLSISARTYPKLKKFAACSGSQHASSVKGIAESTWPELEDLEIWFGTERYGGDCSVADVEPILVGANTPKLKRLGLMNSEFGDDICKAVIGAAVLPQLEHLDLSMGIIGDEGGRALVDGAAKLAHLQTLKISGYFSDEMAEKLRALGPDVTLDVRGAPDEEYRYVEVSE